MTSTPLEPKLLPCPFCGSNDLKLDKVGYDEFGITCENCQAYGPSNMGELAAYECKSEDLHRAWNTRHPVQSAATDGPDYEAVVREIGHVFGFHWFSQVPNASNEQYDEAIAILRKAFPDSRSLSASDVVGEK